MIMRDGYDNAALSALSSPSPKQIYLMLAMMGINKGDGTSK